MKTRIGLCLGASNPPKDEDSLTELGLICFYGRLEVSVETYPRKLTGPTDTTTTHDGAHMTPRTRPENAMLRNQRHHQTLHARKT